MLWEQGLSSGGRSVARTAVARQAQPPGHTPVGSDCLPSQRESTRCRTCPLDHEARGLWGLYRPVPILKRVETGFECAGG